MFHKDDLLECDLKGGRGETNGHLELLGVQDIKMAPWTKEVAVVEMRTTDG